MSVVHSIRTATILSYSKQQTWRFFLWAINEAAPFQTTHNQNATVKENPTAEKKTCTQTHTQRLEEKYQHHICLTVWNCIWGAVSLNGDGVAGRKVGFQSQIHGGTLKNASQHTVDSRERRQIEAKNFMWYWNPNLNWYRISKVLVLRLFDAIIWWRNMWLYVDERERVCACLVFGHVMPDLTKIA